MLEMLTCLCKFKDTFKNQSALIRFKFYLNMFLKDDNNTLKICVQCKKKIHIKDIY